MPMSTYILRRLLLNIPVLLLVSMAVFALVRILPGDEISARVAESGNLRPGDREKLRETLGLDKPFYQAYPEWLGGVLQGDFGDSVRSGVSVSSRLKQTVPISLELAILAVTMACIIGLPAGIISAIYRGSPTDLLVRFVAIIGLSMPSFWTGTLALVLPAFWFGYLPPLTYVRLTDDPLNNLRIMIVPAMVIGLGTGAVLSRLVRYGVGATGGRPASLVAQRHNPDYRGHLPPVRRPHRRYRDPRVHLLAAGRR
jgi:peptide/nickel transport system permease protein